MYHYILLQFNQSKLNEENPKLLFDISQFISACLLYFTNSLNSCAAVGFWRFRLQNKMIWQPHFHSLWMIGWNIASVSGNSLIHQMLLNRPGISPTVAGPRLHWYRLHWKLQWPNTLHLYRLHWKCQDAKVTVWNSFNTLFVYFSNIHTDYISADLDFRHSIWCSNDSWEVTELVSNSNWIHIW